jgi:hypothetical protein
LSIGKKVSQKVALFPDHTRRAGRLEGPKARFDTRSHSGFNEVFLFFSISCIDTQYTLAYNEGVRLIFDNAVCIRVSH